MTAPVSAIFYYRDGCHLCEEMAAFLFRHWPEQAGCMQWTNIDSDSELRDRFNADVPLLALHGDTICRHAPDVERLTRYFGPPLNPV